MHSQSKADIAVSPHLAAHARWHLERSAAERIEFEFGLDLILDGVERLRQLAADD